MNGTKPICLLAVVKNEKRDSFAKQEWGTLFFVNKIVDSSQQLDLSRHRYDCDLTATTRRKTSVCSEVIEAVLKKINMSPSPQAEVQVQEAVKNFQRGVRAVLLGPPGSGKGTQVELFYSF